MYSYTERTKTGTVIIVFKGGKEKHKLRRQKQKNTETLKRGQEILLENQETIFN